MDSSSSIGYYSVVALFLLFSLKGCCAQLSTNYYSTSCPNVFLAIKPVVEAAIARERRMGASLLRLSFHDCFVSGCDGSLLLDDTPTFTGEKNSNANRNSARGFDVIDNVKAAVERVCPGVVSCADIITIVARDSVAILGGPYWDVKLGRRDARTASQSEANNNIPNPTSSLSTLMSKFSAQGLSTKELVALSGAHTIGNARCTNFRARIYNETNIDRAFAGMRRQSCPLNSGSGDNNLAPLDLQTPTGFDNLYYKNLVGLKGLLHSDQQLYTSDSTGFLVRSYADNSNSFNSDFVAAMIKMNDIRPLTRNDGEIRRNCRRVNN